MSARALKFRPDHNHNHNQHGNDEPLRHVRLVRLCALAFCAVASVCFIVFFSALGAKDADLKGLRTTLDPRCSVRGLIAADGARTYRTNQFVRHWFTENSSSTERWFCSEADARAAGFRRVD